MAFLLAIPAFSLPEESQPLCATVWTAADDSPYAPVFGTLSARYSSKAADAFVVGEGIFGVKILRIVPKDPAQEPYIVKQYHRGGDGEKKFEKDWAAIRFLGEVKKLDSEAKTFRVPASENLRPGRNAFKLEDTRGRSLQEVLQDSKVPIEIRRELAGEYNQRLDALEALVRVTPGVTSVKRDSAPWIRGTSLSNFEVRHTDGAVTQLIISVDQVLVSFDKADPTKHQLSLVDGF